MLIFISVILGVFIHESTNHKCDHLLEGFGATRMCLDVKSHEIEKTHETPFLR